MKKSSMGIVLSLIFMLATLGVFYYLWNSAQNPVTTVSVDSQVYAPVDISGAKSQASKLLSGYVNNASVPIPEPNEKLGKTNPFNDPE